MTSTTLCLPVSTIGREYYSVNLTQTAPRGCMYESSYGYFFAVAAEDNTQIEVVPAASGLSGSVVAGHSYSVNLNKRRCSIFFVEDRSYGLGDRDPEHGKRLQKNCSFFRQRTNRGRVVGATHLPAIISFNRCIPTVPGEEDILP